MNLAPALRAHVADLLDAVGPAAPTLCDGWSARDLAAHLVVRDRRVDAMPGIVIERFAGHTATVQDARAAHPYEQTVALVRQGPPRLSPMRIPAVDQRANTAEFVIHAEDVRRAQPDDGVSLPPLPAGTQDAVRAALPTMARMALRRCPVRVLAQFPDSARFPDMQHVTLTEGKGASEVTLSGSPVDILLHLTGRERSGVAISGDDASRAAFARLPLGL